jgi:hypothetical protein
MFPFSFFASKTVGRWERGLTFPSPYFQQKLIDLFGKDAQALGFIAELGGNLRHAPADSYDFKSHRMLTPAVSCVATYFLLPGRLVFTA